jgi:(1->4)-alpha-D-glucan 1-alpha-D-glucosylmutase
MQKAMREAKVHSSWIGPNTPHEEAVERFIRGAMADPAFCAAVKGFVDRIAHAGMCNGLSQVLLKIASPGVPDFYQGNELWDLRLVDPDNRQPVDYEKRRCVLKKVRNADPAELMREPGDGAIKLLVTQRALRFRRAHHDLFAEGGYLPLRATGDSQNHVVAFARMGGRRAAIAVAGRFFTALRDSAWAKSALQLRRELGFQKWRDVFTQRTIEVQGKRSLQLADVFRDLPVALLEGVG